MTIRVVHYKYNKYCALNSIKRRRNVAKKYDGTRRVKQNFKSEHTYCVISNDLVLGGESQGVGSDRFMTCRHIF